MLRVNQSTCWLRVTSFVVWQSRWYLVAVCVGALRSLSVCAAA